MPLMRTPAPKGGEKMVGTQLLVSEADRDNVRALAAVMGESMATVWRMALDLNPLLNKWAQGLNELDRVLQEHDVAAAQVPNALARMIKAGITLPDLLSADDDDQVWGIVRGEVAIPKGMNGWAMRGK